MFKKYNEQCKKGIIESLAEWFPKSPLYAAGILCAKVLEPLKYGYFKYKSFVRFLDESQWWPEEKLREYQQEQLSNLLEYVYKNVPYYRDVFKRRGLTPQDFNSIEDLKKLPILSKEDVFNNFDKLIVNISPAELNKRAILGYTSGSTGKRMVIYRDRKYIFKNMALYRWNMSLANIRSGSRYIQLWSKAFIARNNKNIKIFDPYNVRLSLSTVPQEVHRLEEYCECIKSFKPSFIFGSPSFLYTLACYLHDNGDNTVQFPVFVSCYENLYSYQRRAIEHQFGCEVFNFYGSEESLIYAMECDKHEGMHIDMRKGIMEIVDENGEIVSCGRRGRIICTGFDNFVMPLIRYDMGDIGSVSENKCSCGRGLPLLKSLDGRTSEVIKYKDKHIYPATLSVILEQLNNIKECQFIQEDKGRIIVNVVKRKGYSSNDTRELTEKLRHVIDKDLSPEINFLDYIPRNKMGKFQLVVARKHL